MTGRSISTAEDAAALFRPILSVGARERLCAAYLDETGAVLRVRTLDCGSARDVVLPVREIATDAVRLRAASVVIAHNHPSGDPAPSRADAESTRRLAEALGFLGIRLGDHLVFAGEECRSFRGLGLL